MIIKILMVFIFSFSLNAFDKNIVNGSLEEITIHMWKESKKLIGFKDKNNLVTITNSELIEDDTITNSFNINKNELEKMIIDKNVSFNAFKFELIENIQEDITNQLCNNEIISTILKKGLKYKYIYYLDNKDFFSFYVSKKECEK